MTSIRTTSAQFVIEDSLGRSALVTASGHFYSAGMMETGGYQNLTSWWEDVQWDINECDPGFKESEIEKSDITDKLEENL